MDVFINDSNVEDLTFESGVLEEAVRCVQDDWCAPGQLIVTLRCDGLEISGEQMADMLQKPVTAFKRLEVYTGSPGTLVREVLDQASAALADTDTARKEIAGLLTEGSVSQGVEALAQSLHIWQQIHEAVTKSLHMLSLDPDRVTVKGRPLIEAITRPKDLLMQVKEALEVQDYVLLADVLQYEFDEVAEQWEAILAEIREYADHYDDVADVT